MNKNLIIEDISRITTILNSLNIPTKNPNLVLEAPETGGIPPGTLRGWVRGIESFFDKGNVKNIVETEIDKIGAINQSLSLDVRFEQWINRSMQTIEGQSSIRKLIKSVSQDSREYTAYFVEQATPIFEALEKDKGIEKTLEIIEASFGRVIRDAWKRTGGHTLESIIRKINVSNSREKTLRIWEKYLSHNYYVMDGARPLINAWSKRQKRKGMTLEDYAQEIFDKMMPIVNIVEMYGNVGDKANYKTIFREVNAMLYGLTSFENYMVDYQQLYRALKKKWMQPISQGGLGLELRQADVIIKGLEENNPFKNEYFKSKKTGELWKFLDETTFMDFMRFWGDKNNTFISKMLETIKRVNQVGLYGNMKYVKDWQFFLDKYGIKQGSVIGYAYLQFSANVLLPAFCAVFNTFAKQLHASLHNVSEEEKKSTIQRFEEEWSEAYERVFTPPEGVLEKGGWMFQKIVPFHFLWGTWMLNTFKYLKYEVGGEIFDIFKSADEKVHESTKTDKEQMSPEECVSKYPCLGENGGKVTRNALGFNVWTSPSSPLGFVLISYNGTLRILIPSRGNDGDYIDCATFKNLIPPSLEDKKDEIVNEIKNTALGFQAFCLTNKYTIHTAYDGITAQTIDGNGVIINWWFNKDENTFVPF
jgi:hypothetical protein